MSTPKLAEIIKVDDMIMDIKPANKEAVIELLIDNLAKNGTIKAEDADKAKAAVLKRESLGSTGIGNGIAIPHAMVGFSDKFVAVYGHVSGGMEYGALDGDKVYAIFLLLSPENAVDSHLGIMKELATFSRESLNFTFLKTCESAENVIDLLSDWKED